MRTINVAKSAAVIAAILLLAACSSTPAPTANAGAGSAPPPQVASNAPVSNVTPGSADDFKVNVGDRIFFDYDKYDLSAEARAQLEKQAAWLKATWRWASAGTPRRRTTWWRSASIPTASRRSATARKSRRCWGRTRAPGRRIAAT